MIVVREGNGIVDTMIEAELYLKGGCYSQALERLEEVAERYPRYLPAKEVLAEVFRKTGNIERANEIAREAKLVSQQMAHEHCRRDDNDQTSVADLTRQLAERVGGIFRQVYECGSLEEILRVSAMRLLETLSADRCIIIRLGQEKASNFEQCSEGTLSSLESKTARLNFLILKKISPDSGLVVVDDPMEDPTLIECCPVLDQFKIRGLMACSLVYRSRQIGLVLLHRCTRSTCWSEFEKKLVTTVAGHLAVAMINVQQLTATQAMAITDNLTGLYNRRFFEETFPVELRNAQQLGLPLSLALLDIDDFKRINDTCGHAGGDKVLHKFGFLLKTNLRKGTVVARFGGEEFVVILPNADLKVAHQVMDKIRRVVERTVATDSGDPIRVSIGVSEVSFGGQLELQRIQEELIQRADENLYDAKRSGRNRVCAHSASEGEADRC
jgi:diguanylate cyclase (GGDEF)-like protein